MKNWITGESQAARRVLLVACSTALAAFAVSLPRPADAARVTPPDVPTEIAVEEGNTAFL